VTVQIEIPAVLLNFIVIGWVFVIGTLVVDTIDRRMARSDIYDLMKINLSAMMERLDNNRLLEAEERD